MTASLEKRCRELEELLRLAQSENDAITCQAEDTLLLGRVAEVILEEDVDQKIFEKFLERVAILEDLHYGAHFELDSGEFVLREEYAPFLNSTPSGARLALPADIYDAVLNWDEPPGSIA